MRTLDHALPPMGMWAIEPQAGAERLAYLRTIDTFSHLKQWAAAKKEALVLGDNSSAAPDLYRVENGTAFFAIKGTLTPEPHSFSDFDDSLGGSCYRDIIGACEQMLSDPAVKRVFCDFDTPGGTVDMCYEAAEAMSALNKKKPIHGYVKQACSAGLWLLSTCEYTSGNAAAEAGSMGARMVVEDVSQLYENLGIKVIPIDTGEYKSAGQEGTPLTDAHQAMFQRWVDACAEPFFASVKAGRNLSDAQMKTMQSAEVYVGPKAKSMGLLDKIGSRAQALQTLQETPRKPKPAKASATLTQSAQICAELQEALMSDETITPEQQAHARKGFLEMLGWGHKDMEAKADVSSKSTFQVQAAAVPSEREKQLEADLLQMKVDANREAVDRYASTKKFSPGVKASHEAVRLACVTAGKEAVAAYDAILADMGLHKVFAGDPKDTKIQGEDADVVAALVNGDGKKTAQQIQDQAYAETKRMLEGK